MVGGRVGVGGGWGEGSVSYGQDRVSPPGGSDGSSENSQSNKSPQKPTVGEIPKFGLG